MKLIGMYDSPFVRRVAISLQQLGLPFEHQALSVFSNYDAFAKINPVVKAPSLVTDDGVVLMDSQLILDYVGQLPQAKAKLQPASLRDFARSQRIIGLAMVASEKSVQIVYEQKLRPEAKRHQPWLDRVQDQLLAAYHLLETEAKLAQPFLFGETMLQADISTAVAIRFTREYLPDSLNFADLPALAALAQKAEQSAAFLACPFA